MKIKLQQAIFWEKMPAFSDIRKFHGRITTKLLVAAQLVIFVNTCCRLSNKIAYTRKLLRVIRSNRDRIKIDKQILTFEHVEIEKNKFCRNKTCIFLKGVDIEKVLVYNMISFGYKNSKYFIGYLYSDHKVKQLHIMVPKTSTYLKSNDGQTKWIYLLIEDDNLLENYNTIWDRVTADIKNYLIASLSIIKTVIYLFSSNWLG